MQRDTIQRRLIRRVLSEAARPLAPREVQHMARAESRGIGLATVYRNLKTLVAEGWLVPVELPGEATRYELAGKGHHHHFRCRSCAGVFELEGCALAPGAHVPSGFRVETHEVILYGQCAECTSTDRTSTKARSTKARSTKSEAPNSKQIPNPKSKTPDNRRHREP